MITVPIIIFTYLPSDYNNILDVITLIKTAISHAEKRAITVSFDPEHPPPLPR